MKYRKHFGIFFLYLISWCYMTSALSPYNSIPQPFIDVLLKPPRLRSVNREVLSIDNTNTLSTELLEQEIEYGLEPTGYEITGHHHHIQKRTTKFVGACGIILYLCSLIPIFNIFCILSCLLKTFLTLKYLIFVLPACTATFCLMVNTVFPGIPLALGDNSKQILNVKQFVKFFNVKPADHADYAKSASNALMVTLIKNAVGDDFDYLKPLIEALELENEESKAKRIEAARAAEKEFGGSSKTFTLPGAIGSVLPDFDWDALGSGKYLNAICKGSTLTGPTGVIADIITKNPCLTDILFPGYFVFNRAPSVAWTSPILPLLRAWNMPLYLFAGVKCCMHQFSDKGKRYQCFHKYSILEKQHGLPKQNGPPTVCGAIPDFNGEPPGSKTTPKPGGPTTTPNGCDGDAYGSCETSENPPQAADYYQYSEEDTLTKPSEGADSNEEYQQVDE